MLTVRTPQRSSRVSKRTKAVTKKRSKGYYLPVAVYVGRQAFPKQLFNTLRYVDQITLGSTAGVGTKHQFSTNSLFDPNATGGGHQPMYFDQLAALYDHYCVLRSRIKLTLAASGGLTGAITCCCYIDDDTAAGAGLIFNMERIGAKNFMFSPVGGTPYPQIKMNWDASAVFGPNPQAQDSLQGSATTNPTEQQFYTFDFGEFINLGTFNAQLLVEIEYDCVWDEYTTITNS